MKGNSRITIYAALSANIGIAVIKYVAAAITGSSSMISEAIHSTVDSCDQLLILLGLNQSKKPPDDTHPFGHGQELYFWTLIVSVLIFGLGGGMSVYEGISHIKHPEALSDATWNYAVLIVSALFEGSSFFISFRKFIKRKGSKHIWHKLRLSKDPSLFVVIFEDGAALIGLLLAFCGIYFSHQFKNPVIDGIASVCIGLVLAIVAIILIIESRNLLIGESADKGKITKISQIVNNDSDVTSLRKPLTMQMSPDEVLLALDVQFNNDLDSDNLAKAVKRLEEAIRKEFPDIKQIFIEANNITTMVGNNITNSGG